MASTIPVTFTPIPVPVGIQAQDINQLLTIVSKYLAAAISANVSFFLQGSNFPQSDQGIFFNQTSGQFGVWNSALGQYIPITPLKVGDAKPSYVAGDDVVDGWVEMDGRNVNNVANITQQQKANLETLFGAGATLPTQNFGATSGKVYVGSQ
jgi:hypothetical protein